MRGVPLSNFEVGPGVPLLNFRAVPGPTFKLWEGSRVPWFWSHFYTMPSQLNYFKIYKTIATRNNYFKTKHLTFFVKYAANLGKYIFTPRWNEVKNICFAPDWNSHVIPNFFNLGWNWKFHPGAKFHVWRCSKRPKKVYLINKE